MVHQMIYVAQATHLNVYNISCFHMDGCQFFTKYFSTDCVTLKIRINKQVYYLLSKEGILQ